MSALLLIFLALPEGLVGVSFGHPSLATREKPPGPALTSPPRSLAAALDCPQRVRRARAPVLLVPGAGGDPGFAFSAGLEPILRDRGYPVCMVTLPEAGMGDIQIQAEHLVSSIRSMAARSRRPVTVVGVSQGGMLPRWALKWWPDLRSLVGDIVGLAPDNHGLSPTLAPLCNSPCPPATREQVPTSRFLAALNRGDETPGRLSYSVISSRTDANVPPPSPRLSGERDDSNTQVQEICPGREVDHGHIQFDAVAVALVLDALGHGGPARASRISAATCARKYARGIDPDEVERQVEAGNDHFAANYGRAGLTTSEPPLNAYATRRAPQPRATLRTYIRRLRAGRGAVLSFVATGKAEGDRWALPRARITVAGRSAVTNQDGRATLRLRTGHGGPLRVRLIAPGLAPASFRLKRTHGSTRQSRAPLTGKNP